MLIIITFIIITLNIMFIIILRFSKSDVYTKMTLPLKQFGKAQMMMSQLWKHLIG